MGARAAGDDQVVFREGTYRYEGESGTCHVHVPHDVHASQVAAAFGRLIEGRTDGTDDKTDDAA